MGKKRGTVVCPLHIDCDLEKGMKSVCSQRGGVQCESK